MIDILIVGAGPAGLAAAIEARRNGAEVMLVDEQAAPGGQIYRAVETMPAALGAVLGEDYTYGAGLVRQFRDCGALYRPNTSVWQVAPGAPHEVWISRAGCAEMVQARVVILATGAMERAVPVPGWTLPGAMSAGAVQILLKSSALVPEQLVLAGSGPLLYLLAAQCISAGVRVTALLDTTAWENEWAALDHLWNAAFRGGLAYLRKGLKLKAQIRKAGVKIHKRVTDIHIEGTDRVTAVRFQSATGTTTIETPLVALHEGVIPAPQAARSIGCAFVWNDKQRCFQPQTDEWGETTVADVFVAGDGGGIGGARVAEHEGHIAATQALHRVGRIDAGLRDRISERYRAGFRWHMSVRPFLDRMFPPPEAILRPADDVVICRCEEVTAGALRAVVRQGCQGPNQAKSFLRAGMGACQGRMCGHVVAEIIAEVRCVPVEAVGYYRVRPPIKPISVGELASVELAET